jgi:hypothetical protein
MPQRSNWVERWWICWLRYYHWLIHWRLLFLGFGSTLLYLGFNSDAET